jgi:hypothetical protein
MANVNYSNPSGMFPQVDYKPSGFLGGYLTGKQLQDYQHQFNLSSMGQQMGLLQQGQQMQDFQRAGPHREALRNFEIAQKQAQTPYQGILAQAQGAEAQGVIDQTPLKTQDMRFKSEKEKEGYYRQQVGNHLNAIVRSPMPPQEKMMAWQRIAQQMGIPEKYQNLSLQDMHTFAESFTKGPEYHQAMDVQKVKEEGDTSRKRMDNETDLKVAGIRASADKAVGGTAAAQRAGAVQQWQQAYIANQMAVRGIQPGTPQHQQLVNEATMRGVEMGYGGNPTGRSDAAVNTETAKVALKMTQREMRGAAVVASAEESRKLENGTVFRMPNGSYYRKINDKQAIPVTLD